MRHNLTSELVQLFFIEPYADGVPEDLEGFVLFVELLESELDPRDVGYVSLARSAHLVRINDTGILKYRSTGNFRRQKIFVRAVVYEN